MHAVTYRVRTFRLILDPWLMPLGILAVLAEAYLVYRVSGFVGVEIIGVVIGIIAFHFDMSHGDLPTQAPEQPTVPSSLSSDLAAAKRNTEMVKIVSCGLIIASLVGLIAESRVIV